MSSGSNVTTFGVIENLIIQRKGEIVRPLKAEVRPTTVQNRMGASAPATEGEFTFDFGTFEPSSLLTFVLIGKSGNFEFSLTSAELARLR